MQVLPPPSLEAPGGEEGLEDFVSLDVAHDDALEILIELRHRW